VSKMTLEKSAAGAAFQITLKRQSPFLAPKGCYGTNLPGSELRSMWNLT
jgi:hypothetical protein